MGWLFLQLLPLVSNKHMISLAGELRIDRWGAPDWIAHAEATVVGHDLLSGPLLRKQTRRGGSFTICRSQRSLSQSWLMLMMIMMLITISARD